jgi:nickel-type superoxide dismutase maturation protease
MLAKLRSLFPLARYRVEGESMLPAVGAGERVLVNRLAYRRADPRPGDLVVVSDPRDSARLLLKRIEREAGGRWIVLGDNPAASTDSRAFGAIEKKQIVGKVWLKY